MNGSFDVHMADGRVVRVTSDQTIDEIPLDVFLRLINEHSSELGGAA